MNKFDLIQAISGETEFGQSKCVVSVKLEQRNRDGALIPIEDDFSTEKPIVQISRQIGDFVLVDLIFDNIEDFDLNTIYDYTKRFFEPDLSVSGDNEEFALLSFSIMPKEFNGEYFVLGLNPTFYALVPEDTTGEPRIIRLAFFVQENPNVVPNFLFLHSSEQDVDELINE